jgi:hypothetical protein
MENLITGDVSQRSVTVQKAGSWRSGMGVRWAATRWGRRSKLRSLGRLAGITILCYHVTNGGRSVFTAVPVRDFDPDHSRQRRATSLPVLLPSSYFPFRILFLLFLLPSLSFLKNGYDE